MFKAYKEPPKPSFDYKEFAIEKGLPLAGSLLGAGVGAYLGGPAGVGIGSQIGGSLGGMASGALSEKPGSQATMMRGTQGAIKGYEDWRTKVPKDALDINAAGKIPNPSSAPESANTSPTSAAPTGIGNPMGSLDLPSIPNVQTSNLDEEVPTFGSKFGKYNSARAMSFKP
jgi:hypothetical protein